MENTIIKISPLTKDESNHLRGGFGLINVRAEAQNSNVNCDQTASNKDSNYNCKGCNCGCGHDLWINNFNNCTNQKPAQP